MIALYLSAIESEDDKNKIIYIIVNNYENETLILFNSYLGAKNIVSISKSKKDKI